MAGILKRLGRLLPAACIFLLLAAPAVGEEPAPAKDSAQAARKKENIQTIDDVVVRGEVVNKNLEATSATVLTSDEIVDRIYITPLDIVAQAPGISVAQYKQGGTASSFVMRGFTGNSHGSNTAIFLDGIPLNEGDGYADTNIINPEEIDRIELIKGPSSTLYGNYASAGVLAFYTKKKVDGNHLKLQYGAYNTYEANYLGGFSDDKWEQVYSVQAYHTDGYQDNSDWDKLNAAARITRHLSDDLSVRLSVRGFSSDWDAPGYISQKQFDEDPTQAISETNGGGKDRIAARVDFDYRLNAESKALFYVWHYDQEFWRWYANSPDGLANTASVGNLRNFDRKVYGAGSSYNFLGNALDRELRLTAGLDYMYEDISRDRWYLLAGTGREKGAQYWDYDIEMNTISLYAEASWQVVKPLRLILGSRYDHFAGTLTDHLSNDDEFTMDDQDIFTPKAGLVFTVPGTGEKVEFFANYSKGFALLPGFSEQAAFRQDHWDPQERTQYEGGVRVRPTDWSAFEAVGYRLETTKDFIYDSTTDEYDNVGETTRDGVELSADLYAFNYGYFHADYAYVDATYESYVTGGTDLSGQTLRGVPDSIVNMEIGYQPPRGLGGRLTFHWEDSFFTDDANLFESDDWYRVNAQASYRFGSKARYTAALDVVNLFDEKYADYTSGTVNKTYSPALPLSVYLTLTIDF